MVATTAFVAEPVSRRRLPASGRQPGGFGPAFGRHGRSPKVDFSCCAHRRVRRRARSAASLQSRVTVTSRCCRRPPGDGPCGSVSRPAAANADHAAVLDGTDSDHPTGGLGRADPEPRQHRPGGTGHSRERHRCLLRRRKDHVRPFRVADIPLRTVTYIAKIANSSAIANVTNRGYGFAPGGHRPGGLTATSERALRNVGVDD